MRYHVLAADYDGTLAKDERVDNTIVESLKRLKASGRKLILVTGRELEDLQRLFPEHTLFDRIVAENGALIYRPATLEERTLGERPPELFIQKLKDQNVLPLSVGRVIVSTWEPHQNTVLDAIKDTGLEYQVIFNKGAVMVLPPGINKAKGLHEALKELTISEHNTVAIGDAENDNAMLQSAECAVAVDNALSLVKDIADWTTAQHHGQGVAELIEALINDDLASLDPKLDKHYLKLGQCADGTDFKISPYGNSVLLSGTSGSGKTTFTAAFLEKLMAKQYQYCLIDPEGDYLDLPGVLTIGDTRQPPMIEQVLKLLIQTAQNAVVCTLAIPLDDRPGFFKKLLAAVIDLRKNTGHPHFIIMDEAHHLVPATADDSFFNFPEDFKNFFAITTKPELVHAQFLKRVNTAILMGETPDKYLGDFARIAGQEINVSVNIVLQQGEVLVWQKEPGNTFLVRGDMPATLLHRHKHKYATGDMGPDSFYFKGPDNKLNLKANNLITFIQMAEGVDDETWLFHLHQKDYSKWFKEFVNDEDLAVRAAQIEEKEAEAGVSRAAILQLIRERYTAPA
jgi:hydroxymethylpyrimidine pyrophosphatase-like HAD family hydrolase/energy-coupling factor transporter ATP-binding protein EcfA2